MEILDNYLRYRKYLPEYEKWKTSKDDTEAKRLAYIEKNGVSEEQKKLDIKRAKAVLNAVDVMDEYSQTRAENQEIVTESAKSSILQLFSGAGLVLGSIALAISVAKKHKGLSVFDDMFAKNSLGIMKMPILGSILGGLAGLPFVTSWATKKEIEASRAGRHEAMNKELASEKQFAILTDEQIAKRDEIAKDIKIDNKEAKKALPATAGLGIFKSLKRLFVQDEEYVKSEIEFDKKIKEHESNFDKVQLSERDIEEAKKDQQLISNVIEKIDIASQDYAEDAELATGIFSVLALGSGGLTGFITNKLLKNAKNPMVRMFVPVAVGLITTFGISAASAKIQKQASRVARFKVKQDFMNNPEKLIYVDDEKAKNEDGTKYKKTEKHNFFKFLTQVFKDNKEYNEYLKKENVAQKQKRLAQEQIELTPEQEKRAKQLQMNVFKTFNKVDEKSQMYSESTEAIGDTVKESLTTLLALPFTLGIVKSMDNFDVLSNVPKNANGMEVASSVMKKTFKPMLKSFAIMMLPAILMNIYITREQKNASRVADMRALEELKDPRHYADYSDKDKSFKGTGTQQSASVVPEVKQNKYMLA